MRPQSEGQEHNKHAVRANRARAEASYIPVHLASVLPCRYAPGGHGHISPLSVCTLALSAVRHGRRHGRPSDDNRILLPRKVKHR
eukprot:5231793-Pyramimonas_sp.AAC.1